MAESMYQYVQQVPMVAEDVETPGSVSCETASFLLLLLCGLLAVVPGLLH